MRTAKAIGRVVVLLGLLSVGSLSSRAQSSPATRQPIELKLQSRVLSEERRVLVRLPRHYELDSAARYAVLYKFDGDNQLDRFDHSIDVLSSMDAIPDLIVVALPNGRGARNRDLTPASLHEDSEDGKPGTGPMGRGDRYLDYVEQEVIPYIEKNYRTTQERILAGHSRAAVLVLQSLISKPDLFQARFLFSAPLTREDNRLIVDARKFFKEHPATKSFLYANWGEKENDGMNRSYLAMKAMLASDAPKGMRWTLERARAGDHQSTPIIALPAALSAYFAGRGPGQPNRLGRVSGGPSASSRR